MTTWKQIPIAKKYEASDSGVIRNARTKKILKPFSDPLQEYDRVTIYDGSHRQKVMVHTLVAVTFLGNPPRGKYEIDHRNTNIHDNRPSNLCYVSQVKNHSNPITQFNRDVARIKRAINSGKMSREEIVQLIEEFKRS